MRDFEHFEKHPELPIGQRKVLQRGDRVRIRKVRGHFTFMAHVTPKDRRRKAWVDVKEKRTGAVRSFHTDRIKR